MKIIAYIATDYVYFCKLLPTLNNVVEVFPVVVFEMLHKLGHGQVTAADWAVFWNFVLDNEKPDAIWCYGLPDEVTLAAAKRYHTPVLIQEYYGHQPHNLAGILPYHADWNSFYCREMATVQPSSGRVNPCPNITICLSYGLYDYRWSIPGDMPNFVPGGHSLDFSYWYPNRIFSSYVEQVSNTVAICRNSPELRDCPIRVRLHPRYPELFQPVAVWVKEQNAAWLTIDQAPVLDSLEWSDIVIHVNSNYGFDAVRAGAEVISVGGFAFFDNPLYTRPARDKDELKLALLAAAGKIRSEGKAVRLFIPFLLRDLKRGGAFYHPCLEPYENGCLAEVLSKAVQIPVLDATLTHKDSLIMEPCK